LLPCHKTPKRLSGLSPKAIVRIATPLLDTLLLLLLLLCLQAAKCLRRMSHLTPKAIVSKYSCPSMDMAALHAAAAAAEALQVTESLKMNLKAIVSNFSTLTTLLNTLLLLLLLLLLL
jgi:hypothetical protein